MPYQVSMMGWVGSGEDFCGLGWVQKFWVGLGFEKVTHDQLCSQLAYSIEIYGNTYPTHLNKLVVGRVGSVGKFGN